MESREYYQKLHEQLENTGQFDEFTGNIDMTKVISPDKDYVYLRKDFKGRFRRAFCAFCARIFVPFVNFLYFGMKVKNRKYIKELKGKSYVSVSNHVCPMDVIMLRQVLGFKQNLYCTGAIRSNRDSFKGWFMRGIGLLPFSDNFTAQKNMNNAIAELLNNHSTVQFYPERAMWWEYPKPRPFKKGAFTYAVKSNVPILPIYYCPYPAKGWRKMFGVKTMFYALVLQPVYPDTTLPHKQQIDALRDQTMRQYYTAYRQCYHDDRPLIYDIDDATIATLAPEVQRAIAICKETAVVASEKIEKQG